MNVVDDDEDEDTAPGHKEVLDDLTLLLSEARERVHNKPFFSFRGFKTLIWNASLKLNYLNDRRALTAGTVMNKNRVRDIIDIYHAIQPTNAMFHCVPLSVARGVYEKVEGMMNIFISMLRDDDPLDRDTPGVQDVIDNLEVTMWNNRGGFDVNGHVEDNNANRVRGALAHQRLIRFLEDNHPNILHEFKEGLAADIEAGHHPDGAVNIACLSDFGPVGDGNF